MAVAICPVLSANAQGDAHSADSHTHTGHPADVVVAPSYAWTAVTPMGIHLPATIDTLFCNYSLRFVPSAVSDAYATTGNLGGAGQNEIWMERSPMSDFFFRDALKPWLPSAATTRFYNTRMPMTLLSFNSGGGRENAQERLQTVFSGNINPRAQVGAMLDYLYSKGSYNYQAAKDLAWGVSGSYMGDRYECQAFFNHYNMVNKENGGITDMLYILDPAELQGGITKIDAKAIPTRLKDAHARQSGDQLYINNRYKVGFWREEMGDDTTVIRTYIPVTSFVYTLDYQSGKHIFLDNSASETREFFEHTYLNPDLTRDRTTYWTLSNTIGVQMLEGFNKYVPFGLSAYLRHSVRRYNMTADTLDRSNPALGLDPMPDGISIAPVSTEHLAKVGGILSKQQGSILTYYAAAEIGILGPVAGDLSVDGHIDTRIPLHGDSLAISAIGRFDNTEAPFLTKQYLSNHFVWQNDFGKRRTLTFGGTVSYGRTGTEASVQVSNVQNHIYFDADAMPCQYGGSVQVFSASLRQRLHAGILHWDNRVTYQKTGNDAIIPLPEIAVNSNLYILCRIATLHLQLGIDCDYYTRYYAPGYQPALAAFTNQREMKLGNYPFCNFYANMKLSKARFYVMFSHFNQGIFGGNNYFSMPYYPLNPRRLQIGISVDFAN